MSPTRLSRLESAMRTVLAFHQAYNRQDIPGMMQLVTSDCLFESPGPAPDGTVCKGKEEIARFWHHFFSRSPQAHIEIEEIYGFGDRCVMRWKCSWEDAAGVEGYVRGVDIFRVRDGLICEDFSYVKGSFGRQ